MRDQNWIYRFIYQCFILVGAEGFEPPTLCSQSRCATRLRYAPTSPFDCIANPFLHVSLIQTLRLICRRDARTCNANGPKKISARLPPTEPGFPPWRRRHRGQPPTRFDATMILYVAAIVQWQNACLWHRMSWVRSPLAAPI